MKDLFRRVFNPSGVEREKEQVKRSVHNVIERERVLLEEAKQRNLDQHEVLEELIELMRHRDEQGR